MRILIIGCGNLLAADDAVGIHVIRALRSRRLPENVTLIEAGLPGLNLIHLWQPDDQVIIVDAVRSNSPPGRIHRFQIEELPPPNPSPGSVHGLGLLETLHLARLTEMLPALILVMGIEIANETPNLTTLSPLVEAAVEPLADLIAAEAARISKSGF